MSPKGKLKIIPLGGVEEIGKNIYVIEYADDILVVDCGSIFPKEDMLGVDLVATGTASAASSSPTATRTTSAPSPTWSSSSGASCPSTARG